LSFSPARPRISTANTIRVPATVEAAAAMAAPVTPRAGSGPGPLMSPRAMTMLITLTAAMTNMGVRVSPAPRRAPLPTKSRR
jgi:hypothetical protein